MSSMQDKILDLLKYHYYLLKPPRLRLVPAVNHTKWLSRSTISEIVGNTKFGNLDTFTPMVRK